VKFYAVKVGKEPGVYLTYKECEENITGFKGAICRWLISGGLAMIDPMLTPHNS
jgi:hypothetical protein